MTPLVRTALEYKPGSRERVLAALVAAGTTAKDANAALHRNEADEIWVNDIYQVAVIRIPNGLIHPGGAWDVMQINIRRRDGNVIFRDWRHFQEIKNQLAGPQYEGIELYPAEDRVHDTCNKYHIWVVMDPEFRFPFGWDHRHVEDQPEKNVPSGLRQRPVPKHWEKTK